MNELDNATVAAINVVGRRVLQDLASRYPEASDADREQALSSIMATGGASLDKDGAVVYHDAALRIAPRLAPSPSRAVGSDDDAKLRAVEARVSRMRPLPQVRVANPRAEIAKVPPLPANASDAQKWQRAALLTKIYEGAGITYGGDEDGSP